MAGMRQNTNPTIFLFHDPLNFSSIPLAVKISHNKAQQADTEIWRKKTQTFCYATKQTLITFEIPLPSLCSNDGIDDCVVLEE